jgi:hypothetical protein
LLFLAFFACILAGSQGQQKEKTTMVEGEGFNSAAWMARYDSIEATGTGEVNESGTESFLIEGLKEGNFSIREMAAARLGRYKNSLSIGALIQALQDGDSLVVANAEDSLSSMGSLAVEYLILALGTDNSTLQANAAKSLGRIGDARAIGPLNELAASSNNSMVQTNVAYALRKLQYKREGTS